MTDTNTRQKTQEYSNSLTFLQEDEIPVVSIKEIVGKPIDLTAPEVDEIPIEDILGEDINLSEFLQDEKKEEIHESIIKISNMKDIKKNVNVPNPNQNIFHDDSFENQEESEEEDNVFFIKKEL